MKTDRQTDGYTRLVNGGDAQNTSRTAEVDAESSSPKIHRKEQAAKVQKLLMEWVKRLRQAALNKLHMRVTT